MSAPARNSRSFWAIRGFLSDFSMGMLGTAVSFVAVPVYLHYLSRSEYGYWLTISQTLAFLGLLEFGMGTYVIRTAADPALANDEPRLSAMLSTVLTAFCAMSLAVLLLGCCGALLLPRWFGVASSIGRQAAWVIILSSLTLALSFPASVFRCLLLAAQQMWLVNLTSGLTNLGTNVLPILLMLSGFGLMSLPAADLLMGACLLVSAYYFTVRLTPKFRIHISLFNRNELKTLTAYSGYFQLAKIANAVCVSADNAIIATFLGAAAVPSYVITSKLHYLFCLTLVPKFGAALFPGVSEMYAQKDFTRLRALFMKFSGYLTRIAVVCMLFFALMNKVFVSLWVGPEFYGGTALTAVFLFWVFRDCLCRAIGVFLYAFGDLKGLGVASILEAIVNTGLSIFLVRRLGVVGVALGTAIASSISGVYIPYKICKELAIPIKTYGMSALLLPVAKSLPGVAITIQIASLMHNFPALPSLIVVGICAGFSNMLAFEIPELFWPSNTPWKMRIRQLISLEYTY